MLSSCPFLAFPNLPHMLLFHMPGFVGGELVEPAHPSTPLSGSPSHLIRRLCPESRETALMLFVVQHNGIQYTHINTEQTKSPLKWALVGWCYCGRLPAAAFVVVTFSQIKLCQSNLNRFSSVPPFPSIHQRMPFAHMFILPPGANWLWLRLGLTGAMGSGGRKGLLRPPCLGDQMWGRNPGSF